MTLELTNEQIADLADEREATHCAHRSTNTDAALEWAIERSLASLYGEIEGELEEMSLRQRQSFIHHISQSLLHFRLLATEGDA